MTTLSVEDLNAVNGAALWMIPVGVALWYEFGGGKEFIHNL
ncbi:MULTISPECIES: hypothetical protein [Rheinheimera]|nr:MULTISPECIES: hypothetical protein [Rheinheimera]GGM66134.1 hypothetical protein GCM10010920_28620 [Rheinheimera tangshanensis]